MMIVVNKPCVIDIPPEQARKLIEQGVAECLDEMTVVQPLRDRIAKKEAGSGAHYNS